MLDNFIAIKKETPSDKIIKQIRSLITSGRLKAGDKLPSERIKELGLEFPPAPKPAGVYRPILVIDKFLYISGQAPINLDGSKMQGRAGDDLTMEEAKVAAWQVGLTMLSTIQTHFGDIDKIS